VGFEVGCEVGCEAGFEAGSEVREEECWVAPCVPVAALAVVVCGAVGVAPCVVEVCAGFFVDVEGVVEVVGSVCAAAIPSNARKAARITKQTLRNLALLQRRIGNTKPIDLFCTAAR